MTAPTVQVDVRHFKIVHVSPKFVIVLWNCIEPFKPLSDQPPLNSR
jgi:hypothetical protein